MSDVTDQAREADHMETTPQLVTGVDVSDRYPRWARGPRGDPHQNAGVDQNSGSLCAVSLQDHSPIRWAER